VVPTSTPADESLEELARIANAASAQVHLSGRQLIGHAVEAGEALLRAQKLVPTGEWIAWTKAHLQMNLTTAYRYMRIAEHRDKVFQSDVASIGAALRLLADEPRRGRGPRAYSQADKAAMVALADQIGIKPAAAALGVSPSTIHKWAGPGARGHGSQTRQITEDRIERAAEWLVERFGGYDYPERVTPEVRIDAARLLTVIFDITAGDPLPPRSLTPTPTLTEQP